MISSSHLDQSEYRTRSSPKTWELHSASLVGWHNVKNVQMPNVNAVNGPNGNVANVRIRRMRHQWLPTLKSAPQSVEDATDQRYDGPEQWYVHELRSRA